MFYGILFVFSTSKKERTTDMKRRKFLSLILTFALMLTAVSCFTFSANAAYSYSGLVIYLSDNGDDTKDGKTVENAVKTLPKALELVNAGGTIVITDVFTHTGGNITKKCTIAGYNADSRLDLKYWSLILSANTTFDNITINACIPNVFVLAYGNELVFGDNVTCTKNDGVLNYISVRGGGDGDYDFKKDAKIVVKSGTYNAIHGGTRIGDMLGNTSITIYSGVTVYGAVNPGNNYNEESAVAGNAVVKLVGDNIKIGSIAKHPSVKGDTIMDLSEYTGEIDKRWNFDGMKIINYGEEVPAELEKENKLAAYSGIPGKENSVYLSDNGTDENDGKTPATSVRTLDKAVSLVPNGGSIVVTDIYSHYVATTIKKNCTVEGFMQDSVFDFNVWNLYLGAPVTFDNITLNASVPSAFILANGNELTIGKSVMCTKTPGVGNFLSIRGGGEGNTRIEKDTRINIYSGTWTSIYGGSRIGNIDGNSFITIHDGVVVNGRVTSGNNYEGESQVTGSGVVKLIGKNISIGQLDKHKSVVGESYIDLSEYSGEISPAWNFEGTVVIHQGEKLPEAIESVYLKKPLRYDLSAEKNLVYVSDSGSDENDGRSEEKPLLTLAAAMNALGENGGTVAVVGDFTHKDKTFLAKAPIKLTSVDSHSRFILGVWSIQVNKGIEIDNLHLYLAADYTFLLHYGSPVHIGKNVKCERAQGLNSDLCIRAAESGNYNSDVNITIESGTFATVYTGSKQGNIRGNSTVNISNAKVKRIVFGNDGSNGVYNGGVEGATVVTLSGNAKVDDIIIQGTNGGSLILDISKLEGDKPNVSSDIMLISDSSDGRKLYSYVNAKFISGYPDNTFKPDSNMKICEAITVVSKVGGFGSHYKSEGASKFVDVAESDWFYPNVKYLEDKGLLDFFGTNLRPNDPITRAEFVVLLAGFGIKNDKVGITFTDVKAGDLHSEEIFAAAALGLVNGYPDGSFGPSKTITRAEVVTVINRLLERNAVAANIDRIASFADIADHWAKYNIVAAASEKTVDEKLIWYTGDAIIVRTPEELKETDTGLTAKYLEGLDTTDGESAAQKLEELKEQRIAEIRATKTDVSVKGVSYYVSAEGNDLNDGKTPETAWKTLSKVSSANLSEGDGVFFRRGDIFRGTVTAKAGVTYSAYGEGEKPRLYGSLRDYSESAFWDKTDKENVYVSKGKFSDDVGLIVFDGGKNHTIKKIIGVAGFDGTLKSDLEFYHNTEDYKLYLYSTSDPNTRYTSTEIGEGKNLISGVGHDVTIDNLCIMYTGAHGVGFGDGTRGLTVQNCEFGWIGGMIQHDTTRFGNAVEVYLSTTDYTVTNCYIYEVYDAGITHQFFQERDTFVGMENIEYSKNVIERCTYAIEYVNSQPEQLGNMKNVRIFGNILAGSGEGFGKQRPDRQDAVIKGWTHTNRSEGFIISDNIISSGEGAALVQLGVGRMSYMPEIANNVFIAKTGTKFGNYGKNPAPVVIYNKALTDLTVGLSDNTFIFK